MADDLQNLVNSELGKRDGSKDLPPENDEIALSPEQAKVATTLEQELGGVDDPTVRDIPTPEEIAKAVSLKAESLNNSRPLGANIVPHPKTIAELLHIEAEVAKNPPKAVVPEGMENITDRLKKISYVGKGEASILKKIRTFKSDSEDQMTSGKSSFISIAAAQLKKNTEELKTPPYMVDQGASQKKAVPTQNEAPPSFNWKLPLAIAGIILLLGGGGGAAWYILKNQSVEVTLEGTATSRSLITVQFNTEIPTDGKNSSYLRSAVAAERKNSKGSLNDLGSFSLTRINKDGETYTLTTKEFLQAFEMRAPEPLIRTLTSEYLLGIHRFPENQNFLVLTTDTYDTAYAALSQWERTLEDDIGKLLRSPKDFQEKGSDSTSTPRSFFQKTFKDIVIKNKDTRALFDETGKPIFFYTFVDRQHIVFATDPSTLGEVIVRLATRRTVK